jgi:hypothetical protein
MRTRIRTNSVAKVVIEQEGERLAIKLATEKQNFGKKVREIMTELNLTWEQGKAELKKRTVAEAISREMQNLNLI